MLHSLILLIITYLQLLEQNKDSLREGRKGESELKKYTRVISTTTGDIRRDIFRSHTTAQVGGSGGQHPKKFWDL